MCAFALLQEHAQGFHRLISCTNIAATTKLQGRLVHTPGRGWHGSKCHYENKAVAFRWLPFGLWCADAVRLHTDYPSNRIARCCQHTRHPGDVAALSVSIRPGNGSLNGARLIDSPSDTSTQFPHPESGARFGSPSQNGLRVFGSYATV